MPFFKKEQKAINDKWYPRAVTVGHPVEMDEVCDRIAEMSTASKADSKAVLTALGQVLGSLMNTGRTVQKLCLGCKKKSGQQAIYSLIALAIVLRQEV